MHKKIIKKALEIAKKEQLPVRQTYSRTLRKLSVDQRFRNHPKNKSKAKKAAVDRSYRGRKQIGETQILIPTPFNNKKQTAYQQKKLIPIVIIF